MGRLRTEAINWDILPTSYVACRTLGHAWDPKKTANDPDADSMTRLLQVRCLRCKSWRYDRVWATNGRLIPNGRKYDYAPDYLMPKDVIVPERSAFRLALIEAGLKTLVGGK
jgi:hypothetical protein